MVNHHQTTIWENTSCLIQASEAIQVVFLLFLSVLLFNYWKIGGLGWFFGFLGSPYEKDCYLGIPLESQTTNIPPVELSSVLFPAKMVFFGFA